MRVFSCIFIRRYLPKELRKDVLYKSICFREVGTDAYHDWAFWVHEQMSAQREAHTAATCYLLLSKYTKKATGMKPK